MENILLFWYVFPVFWSQYSEKIINLHGFVAKEVYFSPNEVQRRKEVSGSMEKAPMKYPSLKEVSLVTLKY